jgi:hypothetical protein
MPVAPGASLGQDSVMVLVLGDVHAGELLHGRRCGGCGAGITEPPI